MKTIGIFLDSFHIGGVQKVFLTLIKEWQEMGYNVVVISLSTNGELKENLNSNIIVEDLQLNHLFLSFFKIPRILKKYNIEVLLTGKDGVNLFFILNKLFFHYKTKLFVSQHNYLTAEKRTMQTFYQKVMLSGIKCLYEKADGIICVSNGINDALIKAGIDRDKLQVIYNPVDISSIRVQAKEKCMYIQKPYVMFCGRFSPVKNLTYLLRSFSVFLRSRPNYNLVLVGDGAEMKLLRNLTEELNISNNVNFVGAVSNPYCFMQNAQLVLLTSLNEAFSMVVVEALALGKTVVSTASGGPEEILQKDKGYIVKSFTDINLFAETMVYALEHPKPADVLVRYSDSFSKEVSSKSYLQIFEQ